MTAVQGLIPGEDERNSAKKRRQESYKKDLQLQMLEQDAARKRERIQDMSVNASGWLDPEKGPERLKPLGGSGFMTDRTNRDSKVRPYHLLFNYDRTAATQASQPYPSSTQDAYNFFATRDLDRPAGHGSIIPPLSIPYVDNRPIIMPGRYDYPPDKSWRYNPFIDYEGISRQIKSLIGPSNLENERLKNQRIRDSDEYHRRMMRDLEDKKRALLDDENAARRRIEDLRREAEERRREWERRMRSPDKVILTERPKTELVVVRPSSSSHLVDLDQMRRRMAEERRRIEELLKLPRKPDYTQVRVVKRPPLPPTPSNPDKADPRNIVDFHKLKYRDQATCNAFRRVYPEEPQTNEKLENQQEALLRQQEEDLRMKRSKKAPPGVILVEHGFRRPSWLDKAPTPFPHRLRHRDQLYKLNSLSCDIDSMYRKNEQREMVIDEGPEEYNQLRLRKHRPSSADTLTDDTWLRPTSSI